MLQKEDLISTVAKKKKKKNDCKEKKIYLYVVICVTGKIKNSELTGYR